MYPKFLLLTISLASLAAPRVAYVVPSATPTASLLGRDTHQKRNHQGDLVRGPAGQMKPNPMRSHERPTPTAAWQMSATWPAGCNMWKNPCPEGVKISGRAAATATNSVDVSENTHRWERKVADTRKRGHSAGNGLVLGDGLSPNSDSKEPERLEKPTSNSDIPWYAGIWPLPLPIGLRKREHVNGHTSTGSRNVDALNSILKWLFG